MCGIFGLIIKPGTEYPNQSILKTLEKVALLSESRGKDSSGIAIRKSFSKSIEVIKGDFPIKELVNSKIFKKEINQSLVDYNNGNGFCAFGHARLVTNGSQLNEQNNQPVIKDNIVIVHNGIIVNSDTLWEEDKNLKREYSIDTEIIPSLIRKHLNSGNLNLADICNKTFEKLEGTFSLAFLFNDINKFALATNNGSLYYITNNDNFIVFASEHYFLEKLKEEVYFKNICKQNQILQLTPNSLLLVDLNEFILNKMNFIESNESVIINKEKSYQVNKHILDNDFNKREVVIDPSVYINRSKEQHLFNLLEYNIDSIKNIKRCSKCLLTETFPFIQFDDKGVCNYCHNHKPSIATQSLDELQKLVNPYRRKDKKPDCIVPFSGGRDSTYSLHIVKKELGLNPIAFTYDWGMVTDLARRNIARVCGKLGVENIIVSANIHWKRDNIRKNINAWLKNPELGMIPLFMAGDKFFFYYCNQVKKQTGIDLNIWGINDLENTNFKTGFAGLKPIFDKKTIYSLSIMNHLKLFGFVGYNLLKSPGYINNSIIDSLGSFASRYVAPKKDYFHLFDYYQWDENEINNLVVNEYDWELAIDTSTTWRIGDGTASFYNYIYYTVAGFSEIDTFRSNQIRDGFLDRETALKLVEQENKPRYETLRWYLEIIGVDFEQVVRKVNSIPKMYSKIL